MNTNNICYNKLLHLFIAISFITTILFIFYPSFFDLSFAQQDKDDEGDKLVVKTRIHINNLDLENTEFIRVIGLINGQEAKEDISISSIDKTKKP
jgi:hypothetical protein